MIQANELRIGNWFIGYDNKPFQFDYTDFMIIGDPAQYNCKPFEPNEVVKSPILLTEDILIKSGFEKGKTFSDFKNVYTFQSLWVSLDDYTNIGVDWCDNLSVRCYEVCYLHQLQNLSFALTGKELEVKI